VVSKNAEVYADSEFVEILTKIPPKNLGKKQNKKAQNPYTVFFSRTFF
jgi:hypothetical protein